MSDIEKPIRVFPGYEQLANVLQDALDQAQAGKGSQRHANGKPFLEQPIITDGRACGLAGPAFQARKKILEALRCPDEERAVQDLLGAIVYTAAMVILKEEGRETMDTLASACGYAIQPLQDGDDDPAVVPEVVCTACQHRFFSASENGARIMKTGLCFACKDLGEGPPVRMPPETVLPLKPLPDECLGALCGRVRG